MSRHCTTPCTEAQRPAVPKRHRTQPGCGILTHTGRPYPHPWAQSPGTESEPREAGVLLEGKWGRVGRSGGDDAKMKSKRHQNKRTHNKTIQNRSKNGAWSTLGWHSEAQELHLQLPGSIMRDYGCQTGSHGCPEGLPRRAKIITNEMKSRRQKGSERGGGKRPPKRLSKTPF